MRSRLTFDDPSGLETPLKTPAAGLAPLFVGQLSYGVGARLLMRLFAEGATGRLVVETTQGDPRTRATLVFARGEPVHVEPIEGAPALWRALGEAAVAQSRRSVAGAASALARAGARPIPVLEALRELVRQSMRALIDSQDGTFSYYDEPSVADHVPLVAVNPFGLLLSMKRQAYAPEVLLRLGERVASAFIAPGPDLLALAARILPFTGQVNIAPLVDGSRRGSEIFSATGLDPVVGGLVLATLADLGLVELALAPRAQPRARPAPITLTPPPPSPAGEDAVPLAQLGLLGPTAQELLSLYLELKPERDHTALLGVDIDCKRAALDRAYEARLAQLDPRLVPIGPGRPQLLARIEELRMKLDRAYKAHAARAPRETSGAYLLLEKIGTGGMAEVFRGTSTEDGRVVAIKRIRPENKDDTDFVRKLLDEARLARRVRHPNVVRVYTAGKSGEDLYLAMDFVDGADLHGLLAEGRKRATPPPVEVACRIIADATGGLFAAHSTRDGRGRPAPILHCDVSTSNILVSTQGEVKLTDFGIARALEQGPQPGDLPPSDVSRSPSSPLGSERGMVRGKLPYLSPELFEGKDASVRSDLYAMGMTLYAALVRLPFLRASAVDTMRAVVRDPLPLASQLRPGVPPAIDAILQRACARDPNDRYASAQELQLALEEWLATRPPVDIGAWARPLIHRAPPQPLVGADRERTVAVTAAEPSFEPSLDSSRETPREPAFAISSI